MWNWESVQSMLVNIANRLPLVFLKALILWNFPLKMYPLTLSFYTVNSFLRGRKVEGQSPLTPVWQAGNLIGLLLSGVHLHKCLLLSKEPLLWREIVQFSTTHITKNTTGLLTVKWRVSFALCSSQYIFRYDNDQGCGFPRGKCCFSFFPLLYIIFSTYLLFLFMGFHSLPVISFTPFSLLSPLYSPKNLYIKQSSKIGTP